MSEFEKQGDDNVINLAEKRRQRRRRLTVGSVKERFFNHKKVKSANESLGRQPSWMVYLQFFLLLFLVAWLMRQCGR